MIATPERFVSTEGRLWYTGGRRRRLRLSTAEQQRGVTLQRSSSTIILDAHELKLRKAGLFPPKKHLYTPVHNYRANSKIYWSVIGALHLQKQNCMWKHVKLSDYENATHKD